MKAFIETSRLIIAQPELSDFDNLVILKSDPDVMRYIASGDLPTREKILDRLKMSIAHFQKHKFSCGNVYEKETHEFVGHAGLMHLEYDDTQPEIEIGYSLHKKYWGKGYATELANGIVDWGFKHLSVNKLVGVTFPENFASRRVLENTGMHYLGRAHHYGVEVAKYEILKSVIDYADVNLIPATILDYPIVHNLARFYAYDISEHYGHMAGWEMEDDGLYGAGVDYKRYFEREGAHPFLVKYREHLAGFAIVDNKGSDASVQYNMAQFFISRTYKGKGIGRFIAFQCFDKFHGEWEVMVMPGNDSAYRFWRAIIGEYTQGNFIEYSKSVAHFNNEQRNFFKFSTNE